MSFSDFFLGGGLIRYLPIAIFFFSVSGLPLRLFFSLGGKITYFSEEILLSFDDSFIIYFKSYGLTLRLGGPIDFLN